MGLGSAAGIRHSQKPNIGSLPQSFSFFAPYCFSTSKNLFSIRRSKQSVRILVGSRKNSRNKKKFQRNNDKQVISSLCIFLVDGRYSDWSSWSQCSATCNNGTQQRLRTCTNPPPANGGKQCTGPGREMRICENSTTCPPPGNCFLR